MTYSKWQIAKIKCEFKAMLDKDPTILDEYDEMGNPYRERAIILPSVTCIEVEKISFWKVLKCYLSLSLKRNQ